MINIPSDVVSYRTYGNADFGSAVVMKRQDGTEVTVIDDGVLGKDYRTLLDKVEHTARSIGTCITSRCSGPADATIDALKAAGIPETNEGPKSFDELIELVKKDLGSGK